MGQDRDHPTVRLALLGGGAHGLGALARAVAGLRGWSIAAIADPGEAARIAAARTVPGARLFASTAELLEATHAIDLAIVATPPQATVEVALTALASGTRVLIEKPGARASHELDLLAGAGSLAGCAYNYRFHPAIQQLRAMLAGGHLRRLEMEFIAPLAAAGTWRASHAAGGGALRDLGTHLLDLATWLTGRSLALESAAINSRHTEHDQAHLRLRAGETEIDLHCAYHGSPTFSLRAHTGTATTLTELWGLAAPVRLSPSHGMGDSVRLWTSRLASKLPGMRPAQALRVSQTRMLVAAVAGAEGLATVTQAAAILGWVEQAEATAGF
jgi:predicted dehydrogenase